MCRQAWLEFSCVFLFHLCTVQDYSAAFHASRAAGNCKPVSPRDGFDASFQICRIFTDLKALAIRSILTLFSADQNRWILWDNSWGLCLTPVSQSESVVRETATWQCTLYRRGHNPARRCNRSIISVAVNFPFLNFKREISILVETHFVQSEIRPLVL